MPRMAPWCMSNSDVGLEDLVIARVKEHESRPLRALQARWEMAFNLLPADFFDPKDPSRFKPLNMPIPDLLPNQQPNSGKKAKSSKREGRKRKSALSYRQSDLEWRLKLAAAVDKAPFATINALAEYVSGPLTSSIKRHLYTYLDSGKGLGRKPIEHINSTLQEHGGPVFAGYDMSAVPLHMDWKKDWEDNDLRYHRRLVLLMMMKVAFAVIDLQRSRSEPAQSSPMTPFPKTRTGWDDFPPDDPAITLLRGYEGALAEGFPRGSVEFWVWWLAYERLVIKKEIAMSVELIEGHASLWSELQEPIAPGVPLTRFKAALGAGALE